MKKMKKLASILLAAIMVLAMAVPAMAGNVTITGTDGIPLSSHKFTAYQIFTGTQTNDDQTLTDIEWGSGVKEDEILTAVQTVGGFEDCKSAREVAEKLDEVSENKSILEKFIAAVKKALSEGKPVDNSTKLGEGYYLFVDDTEDLDGADDARNASLLQVTGDGNIEITVKTDKPSVEKKVKENVKEIIGNEDYGDQYNDVADYNIDDHVPFQFYSKVPDMTYYETYEFTFHDTMEKGLTFDSDSLVVTINGTELEESEYTVTTSGLEAEETFTVHIVLKSDSVNKFSQGQEVRITYTATLNKEAVIGLSGNKNTVYLEYSNNPDGTGTGKTKPDTVIVFTYELDVNKKSGKDSTALQGAEFILTNMDGNKYAKVDKDGKFNGWVEKTEASTLTSDEDGVFKIIGLDDGTYKLIETKAPAGYNLLKDPITLVVKATTNNTQTWAGTDANEVLTALKIDIKGGENEKEINDQEGNIESGIVKADVINNSGAVLPETGGIGTTRLYVIGSILVLGAVILLVTKRRMNAEK